jgi:hypothetical protein
MLSRRAILKASIGLYNPAKLYDRYSREAS